MSHRVVWWQAASPSLKDTDFNITLGGTFSIKSPVLEEMDSRQGILLGNTQLQPAGCHPVTWDSTARRSHFRETGNIVLIWSIYKNRAITEEQECTKDSPWAKSFCHLSTQQIKFYWNHQALAFMTELSSYKAIHDLQHLNLLLLGPLQKKFVDLCVEYWTAKKKCCIYLVKAGSYRESVM